MGLQRRSGNLIRSYLTQTAPEALHLPRAIALLHEIWSDGAISSDKALKRLDFLFYEWNEARPKSSDAIEILSSLNQFVFEDKNIKSTLGLGPNGLLLPLCLERREGHPFMVNLIYQELARKEGHALVDFIRFDDLNLMKCLVRHQLLFISPAEKGRLVAVSELEGRLLRHLKRPVNSLGPFIETPSLTSLLVSYLIKLKDTLVLARQWEDVIFALDMLIEVNPLRLDELRERGVLLYQLGEYELAHHDLEVYLSEAPPSPENEKLKILLQHLKPSGPRLTPNH
ncbi:MAG: tetratricopeptide repeat protein [Oligoflexia bacterium]|nr:tetratricopeptide repeat protein [Oligoflexia bacterium]